MFSEATEDYLMGSTVTVPKGVTIDPTMPVHPTFLYESIWCFVGLALQHILRPERMVMMRIEPDGTAVEEDEEEETEE